LARGNLECQNGSVVDKFHFHEIEVTKPRLLGEWRAAAGRNRDAKAWIDFVTNASGRSASLNRVRCPEKHDPTRRKGLLTNPKCARDFCLDLFAVGQNGVVHHVERDLLVLDSVVAIDACPSGTLDLEFALGAVSCNLKLEAPAIVYWLVRCPT
jgi:hypothetical protein